MRLSLILLFLQLWVNVDVSLSQNACEKLPEVLNGFVSEESKKSEYQQGNLLYFNCEIGYVSGPTITYACTDDGWVTVRQGKCSLKPCELPDDTPNGYYQIVHGEDFVFGTTIKYMCNEGYQMVSKVDTRTCMLNKWTNHLPICEPLSCDPPPADGRVTVKGLPYNDGLIFVDRFLTFSCDAPGKYLNGSPMLICDKNGEWTGPFPSCEDVTCEAEVTQPFLNVIGLPSENETMKYGHKLQFACHRGYLDGVNEVKCLETRQWNARFPTCTDACEVPGVLPGHVGMNSRLSSRPIKGTKLRFQCRKGLFLQGAPEIECLANGQWSDGFPTCQGPVGCGQPPQLADGDIKDFMKFWYNHGERVEYLCQSFYTLNGQSHKTCNNGEWIGEMRCLISKQQQPVGGEEEAVPRAGHDKPKTPESAGAVVCGQPPQLTDGDINGVMKFEYNHGERVEYLCQSFYTLDGQSHKTCNNGEWIGEMRCLRPCTVTEEDMRQNNIAFRYTYDKKLYSAHNDEIEFMCIRGRHRGRLLMRQSCNDGVLLLPSCQR